MGSNKTNLKCPASSPTTKGDEKPKEDEYLICAKPATKETLKSVWCEGRRHASCSKLSAEQCYVIVTLTTPNIAFSVPLAFMYFLLLYGIMTANQLSIQRYQLLKNPFLKSNLLNPN